MWHVKSWWHEIFPVEWDIVPIWGFEIPFHLQGSLPMHICRFCDRNPLFDLQYLPSIDMYQLIYTYIESCVYIYIYICVQILCIYIYTYIHGNRDCSTALSKLRLLISIPDVILTPGLVLFGNSPSCCCSFYENWNPNYLLQTPSVFFWYWNPILNQHANILNPILNYCNTHIFIFWFELPSVFCFWTPNLQVLWSSSWRNIISISLIFCPAFFRSIETINPVSPPYPTPRNLCQDDPLWCSLSSWSFWRSRDSVAGARWWCARGSGCRLWQLRQKRSEK